MTYIPYTDYITPTSLKKIYVSSLFDTATGDYPKTPISQPVIYNPDINGHFIFFVESLNESIVFNSFQPLAGTTHGDPFSVIVNVSSEAYTIDHVEYQLPDLSDIWHTMTSGGSGVYISSSTIDPQLYINANKKGTNSVVVRAVALEDPNQKNTVAHTMFMGIPQEITSGNFSTVRVDNNSPITVSFNISGSNGSEWTKTEGPGILGKVNDNLATITDATFGPSDEIQIHTYTVVYSDHGYSVSKIITATVYPAS